MIVFDLETDDFRDFQSDKTIRQQYHFMWPGVRPEEPAPAALEPKQVNALLRAVQQTRYPLRNNAIVQMMIQTGMRIGECAALQWGDIEMGERKGRVRIRSGKGDKTRFVPLNQSARQALVHLSVNPYQVYACNGRPA